MGPGRGGGCEKIKGIKLDSNQHKQRSEYFALWRANDFAPEQVRECIYRRLLNKPMTLKLLDASREC